MTTSPRLFHLQRDRDISGVSGTGRVADGVLWSDGTVAIRWIGDRPSTVHWDRLADAEAIHGHGGATRIVWADEQPPADQTALRDRIAEALTQAEGWTWAHGVQFKDIDTPTADAYRKLADAVLAVLPEPTPAAALSATERTMLTYALDQAQEKIWSEDGFTDEDQAAVDALRRLADEAQPAQPPYPPTADFAVEAWEGDLWVGITYKRKTLDDARQRRDSYRHRFPGGRFRIIRWDETATVVESDPQPTAEAQQDGATQ